MRCYAILIVILALMVGFFGDIPTLEPVKAQDSQAVSYKISFDEVRADGYCTDALNTYAPDIRVVETEDTGAFGPAITVESGEASGIAPECQISPGNFLVIRLNRPAFAISFNRYGTVGVSLTNNGDAVGIAYDVSSGLGGRYERTEFVGFDEIIIAEDSGTTPLLIDEIEIRFDRPAVTAWVDFQGLGFGEACVDALNGHPLLSVTTESSTEFGEPLIVAKTDAADSAPECEFNLGNQITITLLQPAVSLSFDLYGGATLQLFLEGAQVGSIEDVQGLPIHYRRTRVGGFDQIILTEPSGFSSFQLDNLAVTFLLDGQVDRIDFDGAAVEALCADVIAQQNLDVTASALSTTVFGLPFVSNSSEAGGIPACEFNPGNSLTLDLARPAKALSFTIYGGAEVQLLRDGALVGVVEDVGGLPRYYARIEAEGFDQIIITEPSGFSSFEIDNIQIIYVE